MLITTPDHLHVTIAKAALGAGKHVYLEKPTLHRWHERKTLIDASQNQANTYCSAVRSNYGEIYKRAKEEYVDSGKLGQIVLVRAVWHDFSWQRRKIVDAPKPRRSDWERFLGPAPHVPYQTARYDSYVTFTIMATGFWPIS